ncbi:ComEC/Rec2 family competence protein [Youngiibacter multivorans]|uniref:ComEC/Rec2-related protein n=1 Tax=Youngiibacter multivorans TaxID=937251 RepID=A0ABS4G0R3_9CLOT|nr:ComEC/Rec2 family competence protein [Youngiibacter multivorans]MBP1918136.1 ComEC/Rec2-related protein [Youngiibacter multivorans]
MIQALCAGISPGAIFLCMVSASIPLTRYGRSVLIIPAAAAAAAFLSVNLYYSAPIPESVRIGRIYSYRAEGTAAGRKYLVEGIEEGLKEGDIISGRFVYEAMPINKDGYIGKLVFSDYRISIDLVSCVKRFRADLGENLKEWYGYDRGSLMGSLVLGYRTELSPDRMATMESLGILHILSISGFHIALLEKLFERLRLRRSGFAAILLYGAVVDSVPSYRAVLMSIYKAIGRAAGRDPDPLTGLAASFMIQASLKPYLVFSYGFALTYVSSLGMMLLGKRIGRRMTWMPSSLGSSLATTVSALALSFPFVVSMSGGMSAGVFAGNIAMVPIYTAVTYASFASVLLGPITLARFMLEPVTSSMMELALRAGEAASAFSADLGLLRILMYYPAFLAAGWISFRKRRFGLLFAFFICGLLISVPIFERVEIINDWGDCKVVVSSGFRTVVISGERVPEAGEIALEKPIFFTLGGRRVEISRGTGWNSLPEVRVEGKRLKIPTEMSYYNGMAVEADFIFIFGKVYRLK